MELNPSQTHTKSGKAELRCNLCGGGRCRVAERLTGSELRALWKELGHEFNPDAWSGISREFVVEMHQCETCGFTFFDPTLAGNECFYQELEHPQYFCPSRPEFSRTLEFASRRGLSRVLDVGCGSGAFLDLAKQAGMETFGLELNSVAAEKARSKGHQVFEKLLDQLASEGVAKPFTLITFFQVLEHVRDPVQMVREAAMLLKPSGIISVAVPSDEGAFRLTPWDPHQWPPHHLSRWRVTDLTQLSRAAGLTIVNAGRDILLGSEIEYRWKLQQRLASVLGKRPLAGGGWLPRLAAFVYRKTGMKFVCPHWGSSIYAYLQKS